MNYELNDFAERLERNLRTRAKEKLGHLSQDVVGVALNDIADAVKETRESVYSGANPDPRT